MMIVRRAWSWIFLASVCLLAGCGSSDNRVSISGTVELDGKPLGGATLGFITEAGSSMSSASTSPEGKFFAKVAAGVNKVSVSKPDPNAAPHTAVPDEQTLSPTDSEMAKLRAMPKPKTGLPDRFADPKTSGLQFDIKSGMEPLSISLTSK
jgi:hypothetical protein